MDNDTDYIVASLNLDGITNNYDLKPFSCVQTDELNLF